MLHFLLDTNIISFLVRKTYPAVDHKFNATAKNRVFTSSICEAEVRFGLALLPANAKIRQIAEAFLADAVVRPWTSACAERYASMSATQQRMGKLLAPMDALIAAHALAEDCILVTNDQAFLQVEGLRVEDWTKGPHSA